MLSLHKLTTGTGYDYLTRQVAAMDSTEKGHATLADYHEQKGESPGRWVGSGLVGIEGLNVGDLVSAEQMWSLFGLGDHPLAKKRLDALGPDATVRDYRDAARLGQRFGIYAATSEFRVEVAKRVGAWNTANGRGAGDPAPLEVRAAIRTAVGRELFGVRYGREPKDQRELSGFIARESRSSQGGVAGYDLTFSPVKSVSALWALADPRTAAIVERCHQEAVTTSLRYLEEHALFTRRGKRGVRQVTVTGLVAAQFTHRDSRAGDPDLHTHVAVANKVQAVEDGAWLAIDGRLLFKANVAASEVYNTALEANLVRELGVRFVNRPSRNPERPVREIVGMDASLLQRWSQRDLMIVQREGDLVADFQQRHSRTPTPTEKHALAQRATLETRQKKHSPRSEADQRRTWGAEAVAVLGREGLARMLNRALHPGRVDLQPVDERWLNLMSMRVVEVIERKRSTWQVWHVEAEAQRQVRMAGVADPGPAVGRIVQLALTRRSVRVSVDRDGISEPAALRRPDGTSVYVVAGASRYTSQWILDAEARLLAIAGRRDGMVVDERSISLALLQSVANRVVLNTGQVELVRAMATSGARLQLAIAPAGAGKTTAMEALAAAWTEAGGNVIGLAPSAAAAQALGEHFDGHTDTLHLLTQGLASGRLPEWADRIGSRTLVVIDEAGMADTLTLEAAVSFVVGRGGSVRLVGDDRQLSAVEAGGILRDIAAEYGAIRLDEVVRFADPAEAAASLALREGRPTALGFYLDRQRVHVGDAATILDQAFDAWAADRASGLDSLMLAPTRELVAELNRRGRRQRVGGEGPQRAVLLGDGNVASVGETVVTRRNERRLRFSAQGWVRNGDRWTVVAVEDDASLTVANRQGWRLRLPADYVRNDVELGYASTIHGAQGATVDTMHGVVTGAESRQQLYTMLTRGRAENHVYVQLVGDGDVHSLIRLEAVLPPTATDVLEAVLGRDEAELSATSARREQADPVKLLQPAADKYVDALGVGAEQVVGAARVAEIEEAADQAVLYIADYPSWSALKAQLLLFEASGVDAIGALREAVARSELDDAHDPAAVLLWRLVPDRTDPPGPLPWLPGIPQQLAADPIWGAYLEARHELVAALALEVARPVVAGRPQGWQDELAVPVGSTLSTRIAIWRAANGVDENDPRPTGEPQTSPAAANWQRLLDKLLATETPEIRHWTAVLRQQVPQLREDPHTPVLARRLAAVGANGGDAAKVVRRALAEGPLPDDHAAAALASRIDHPRRWPPIAPDAGQVRRPRPEDHQLWQPGHDPSRSPGVGY